MKELFPDEVVTRARVRGMDLPLGAGRLALVTLDNGHDHTKPNTLGPQSLEELDRALDEAFAMPDVKAVAVTGKPFILAAGADLKGIGLVRDRETAHAIAHLGHRVLRRLGEGPVPSFAFVNGMALGGGLEVALHCTYRTVSTAAQGIGLPETFIGIVPGWGGAWLVPNLVGIDTAVTVVVENPLNTKVLGGAQVRALGLADAAFEGADFLEQSMVWAAQVLTGAVEVERPEVDRSEEAWDAAIVRGRAAADAKVKRLSPAPYRALDLLAGARTCSRDDGFAAEDDALADLLMTDETRATLYAFDLVQRRAKRPVGAPDRSLAREVTKVGVVGAGLMASQLALLFARRLEVPVVMTDLDQDRVDKGLAYVRGEVDKLLGKGRISPDRANRLKALVNGSVDKAGFADADFVIEAVFEQLEVKKQVFAEVEEVVSHECVLATNTSSLSVTEMAADLKNPERVVGLHFFNPVAVMPLLEVVRAERTDDPTLATAFAVGKALKKSSVLVKDAPAFVFNRLLTRALGEAIRAVDEGTPFAVADRALAPLGMPMPPFVLLQLVGPAVALHTAETLQAAFPDRFGTSAGLQALVAAGKPGVYAWDEHGRPSVDPEVAELWPQGGTLQTEEQVLDRTRRALADEIRIMLDDGVVAEIQDIDLCLLLGGGFVFANGGVAPYLDRTGTSEAVTGRRFLPPGVASVPA
ncbi:MAG TPA: 3-hydroxyacyl-CoA dehydrogenase NAD-binding domain-containing protein [Jiangellales bacterium]|nr:3-hydroxyacyl-CoA dehydrogenase NAD-binding domain-containing protein [Jiangellales bacterium]